MRLSIQISVIVISLSRVFVLASLADQNFCGEGGCLLVTDAGEILFGNQNIGDDLWPAVPRNEKLVLECNVMQNGKYVRKYVTLNEEKKELYLSTELKPTSYWKYNVAYNERQTIINTIQSAEALNGGPYFLAPDKEKPLKRKDRKRKEEHTAYPVKITNHPDDKGINLRSRLFSP